MSETTYLGKGIALEAGNVQDLGKDHIVTETTETMITIVTAQSVCTTDKLLPYPYKPITLGDIQQYQRCIYQFNPIFHNYLL